MKYVVSVDGRQREVEIGATGVTIDGRPVQVDVARLGATSALSIVVDGHSTPAIAHRSGRGAWRVLAGGHDVTVRVEDERTARVRELSGAAAGSSHASALKAPMPGLVVKVEVAEGEEVVEGQGLIIVEAMKMENELKAVAPGRVIKILVAAGDAVEKDQVLMEFGGEEGD